MPEFSSIDSKQLSNLARELGRECGSCSLCCKIFDAPELNKPRGEWCRHCDPGGKRCTVYDVRPPTCREFYCQWLVDATFGPEWQPNRSKMVLKMMPDASGWRLDVHVDPAFPNAWRRHPYYDALKELSERIGVCVSVGSNCHLVFPDKDIPTQARQ